MVDEDDYGVGFGDDACEFTEGLAHETCVKTHVLVTHFAFDFVFRDECSDRVDDHNIDSAGANESFDDLECLFTVIWLRDKEFVDVDADTAGIERVESMLGIDEGSGATQFLDFSDGVQGEGGFTGGFWTVDFDDAAAWETTDTERGIERETASWNCINISFAMFPEFHD